MDHSSHLLASVPPSFLGLIAALFVMGLAGSLAHCAAMCGPFVLAQIPVGGEGRVGVRLVRGALFPYHLGRATTYVALGALAGGLGRALASATALEPVLAGFLLLAAALFLLQALRGLGVLPAVAAGGGARLGSWLAGLGAPFLRRGGFVGGYALGLTLGFLPCGLLYGALAASAGAGSAPTGAAAMAAFSLATMPMLMVIGCLGAGVAGRWRRAAAAALVPLQAFNALVLAGLALGGGVGVAG